MHDGNSLDLFYDEEHNTRYVESAAQHQSEQQILGNVVKISDKQKYQTDKTGASQRIILPGKLHEAGISKDAALWAQVAEEQRSPSRADLSIAPVRATSRF